MQEEQQQQQEEEQQEGEEEVAAMPAEQEAQERCKEKQKEQVQKILAGVRQNFGKISVAPEFNDEDLDPVEMADLDPSDFSDVEEEDEEDAGEEEKEEEQQEEQAAAGGQVGRPSTAAAGVTKGPSNTIRQLDEKIAKYKQFLDRAKSKRFSAIRYVPQPGPIPPSSLWPLGARAIPLGARAYPSSLAPRSP